MGKSSIEGAGFGSSGPEKEKSEQVRAYLEQLQTWSNDAKAVGKVRQKIEGIDGLGFKSEANAGSGVFNNFKFPFCATGALAESRLSPTEVAEEHRKIMDPTAGGIPQRYFNEECRSALETVLKNNIRPDIKVDEKLERYGAVVVRWA
jgi:hypothetical protein